MTILPVCWATYGRLSPARNAIATGLESPDAKRFSFTWTFARFGGTVVVVVTAWATAPLAPADAPGPASSGIAPAATMPDTTTRANRRLTAKRRCIEAGYLPISDRTKAQAATIL